MRRILVYDRAGAGIGEISPNDVFSAVLRERINGEHSLEITTTQVLEKGMRLLHEDGRGIWREFSVSGVDSDHAACRTVVGTYYCPWSVQEDLMGVTVSVMPGVQVATTASLALESLLSSQSRWVRGTVTNTATGGASMYDRSAWDALKVLVDTWGGEVDTSIGVDDLTGVVTRSVDLYAKQGNQTAKRRFDFGADADGIVRKIPDEPLYCRISPRGKGEQTDAGGYGRKITIESVNSGKDYLEYSSMVDVAKVPNGSNGYIYPTKIVVNSKMETPSDLKSWAQGILAAECTPKVTYSVDVIQSDEAGTSMQGVSLGDAVQVVDAKFGEGLRIEARVVSMTTDLVAERVTNVELGSAETGIAERFANVGNSISQMANTLTIMSTAQYVDELVGRINTEVNGTGGYTYIVNGEGIICYDVAVADPLIGTEASKVVQVKGGSIRIADTKNASFAGINDWQWKTVFTSGHIAAEVVTAANITAGYIGSSGDTFIDLDNHTVQLGQTSSKHLVIDSSGIELFNASTSLLFAGTSNGQSQVRVGTTGSGYGNVIMSSSGSVDVKSGSNSLAHFGYGSGNNSSGGTSYAPYYDIGVRKSGTAVGNYSAVFGQECTASGSGSLAEGYATKASGVDAHAEGYYSVASGARAHAEHNSTASGEYSHSEGFSTASGYMSHASGNTIAGSAYQFTCGQYNSNNSNDVFEVGYGSSSARANAFRVTTSKTAYVGSTQVTSDRRVKEPLGDISEEEAAEFVRQLKPSKFVKFGRRELGFYAQDIEETNLGEYLVDQSNDHGYEDFRNLSYDGLIAPLVSYCQHLEKRIAQLEREGGKL